MNTTKDMLPLTEAFYYLLLTLYSGPAHGYGIMQEVEKVSLGRVVIGAGTLYTALNTLLKKGLIENVANEIGADSRRKTYSITGHGRQVLLAEMERMEELLCNGRKATSGEAAQNHGDLH